MHVVIAALDHVVLLCRDITAGIDDCTRLFGRGPARVSEETESPQRVQPAPLSRGRKSSAGGSGDAACIPEESGLASALFTTGNCGLELVAPVGEGPGADRARELLAQGHRLTSLAFRVDDIESAHRSCDRRGLSPGAVTAAVDREPQAWRRFRLGDAALHGIEVLVIDAPAPPVGAIGPGDIAGLDHVVIDTPDLTRAAATYGARLGLRLALERRAPEWNVHFLFFRVHGVTLEVIRRLDVEASADGRDRLWGLTWAVQDIHAAHRRLAAAGLDLSEVRSGRKPGTDVFTVRDGTLGVPTLFIAATAA